MNFPLLAGILSVLIWSYLLLARGRFWLIQEQLAPVAGAVEAVGKVVVVIPARNEAETIGLCVASLLSQARVADLHIILVDDGSSDGTAQTALKAAAEAGRPAWLTVLEGQSLPLGWTGKLWTMHQGIEKTRTLNPKFVLLSDADIKHAPDCIASLAAQAEGGDYDLASYMVKLRAESFAEKLLIPAFVYFFFQLYPPAWITSPRHSTAGAAGGCILIRPEALERAGGITAIRGEIIDDCALARRVKRSGGRVWLGLTASTVSLRPYKTFPEIARVISRTAFSQLQHSTRLLAAAMFGLSAAYLLPLALLLTGRPLPMALGATAWAAMTISYLPMIRFYRLNLLWTLLLPVTALFYMAATVQSALQYWSGYGGEWKGRVQDPAGWQD